MTPYVERPLLAQAALDEQDKTINISDADIQKYWSSVYQVNAEHFLLKVDKDASQKVWDEKKNEAEDLYKEFLSEKQKEGNKFNFADFAKKKAEELNKKEAKSGKEVARYENLGFFSKGQMVKPFEDACFDEKAKPGDIVGPIKTEYGYHIIHIIAKKPMNEKYDEPPKAKVKLALFTFKKGDKKSEDAAKTSATSVSYQLKRGMSFDRAIELSNDDENLKKNKGLTDWFTAKDKPEIFNAAEKLKIGDISEPILTSTGYAVIQVVDKKAAVKASLENKDVYNKVKDDLMKEKKQEVEKEFIEKLKKQYKVRTTDPWKQMIAFFKKHFGKQWDGFVAWWNKATGKTSTQPSNTQPAPTVPGGNTGGTKPLQPINGGGS